MCKKCFGVDAKISARIREDQDLATNDINILIKVGYLPCMCKLPSGQFTVCHEEFAEGYRSSLNS